LIFVGAPIVIGANAASAAEKGYIIEQDSGMLGPMKVWCKRGAIKILQKRTHCAVIMKAPNWKVSFLNTITNALYQTDAAHWRGQELQVIGWISMARYGGLVAVKGKSEHAEICGVQTTVTHLETPEKNRETDEKNTITKYRTMVSSVSYSGATAFGLPPQALQVVQRYYKIPAAPGFPMRVSMINQWGSDKDEITTSKCERAVVPDSTFELPKKFHLVKNETEVQTSKDKELYQDFLNGMNSE
jgi:hypothetical protein